MKFVYPDSNDKKTSIMISDFESYEGYWEASERKVLKEMEKHMSRQGALLDAGCGEGRLLERFAPLYEKIVGIEPDLDRYAASCERIKGLDNVDVINGYINDFEGQVDDILCSHVIQHLSEDIVLSILSHLSRCIRKGGLLFLTTNHSTWDASYFTKSALVDGVLEEMEITREEFNGEMPEEVLKIKSFTIEELESLLGDAGFEIMEMRVFHNTKASKIVDAVFGVDYFENRNMDKKRSNGKDIMVIGRKK